MTTHSTVRKLHAHNQVEIDPVAELGREAGLLALLCDADGSNISDRALPNGASVQKIAKETSNRLYEVLDAIATMKATTPAGALAQIIAAAEALGDLEANYLGELDDEVEAERDKTLRKLWGVLYSVADVLEKESGCDREEFSGGFLLDGTHNPHRLKDDLAPAVPMLKRATA